MVLDIQKGAIQLLLLVCSVFASDPTVSVEQGQITGTRYQFQANGVNHEVDAYLGIPYAETPVGPLRFKPPVPKEWKGELTAQKYGKICPQMIIPFFAFKTENMDEDCLVLNVFVPQSKPSNAAVMFWIHGGGYAIGAGSFMEEMDAHPLAALGDVIVVTINYRLNAFGFLSTGDEVVPGNMGMLDQVEAMKWVQKNIAAFGGNPDQVTIFGESAGAGSVSLHSLSPLSAGLFSRAIMQSGVAIAPWARNIDTANHAKRAFTLGKLVGCNEETTEQLVDQCLRNAPVDDIINATMSFLYGPEGMEDAALIAFGPVIHANFLPEDSSSLIEKRSFNRADIMSGYNADEGTMQLVFLYPNATEKPHVNASVFEQMISLSKITPFLQPLQRDVLELVYFDDSIVSNPNANYADAFSKLLGDYYFACSNDVYLRGAYEAINVGSVYAYYFNHHPSYSLINTPWSGACHADDLVFFGYHFLPNSTTLTDVEVDMTMKMIQYWSNFAKTGNPNIASEGEENSGEDNDLDWPQYTPDEKMYQELAPEMRSIPDPNRARCRVWNEYIPKLEAWMD
ncbi:cholinesterase-like [Amphiura filiformis]|uniref:cholinesterase-like n=1 Tax=Amphiura filiformis TaxID=82378 RepID=UPI003B2135F5